MIAQVTSNTIETKYEFSFAAIRCTLQIMMILNKMLIQCSNCHSSFFFMMKKYNMNIYNRNLFHLTCDQFLYLKHKKISVQEKKGEQKLKSISVLVPFERVQASLSEIGFLLDDTVTIVADGKFWTKMLYIRDYETISVSEEIGDAYPKDPIITICGSKITISKVLKDIGG